MDATSPIFEVLMRFIRKGGRIIPIKDKQSSASTDKQVGSRAAFVGAAGTLLAGHIKEKAARAENYHLRSSVGFASNATRSKAAGRMAAYTAQKASAQSHMKKALGAVGVSKAASALKGAALAVGVYGVVKMAQGIFKGKKDGKRK